jgi:hypothetical protein
MSATAPVVATRPFLTVKVLPVQPAIDSDVKDNLPGFSVTSEGPASFAGSLAYTVYAFNKSQDTAVVETGVLRQTNSGYNVFDILHAVNGSNVNLQALEAQWQWK